MIANRGGLSRAMEYGEEVLAVVACEFVRGAFVVAGSANK